MMMRMYCMSYPFAPPTPMMNIYCMSYNPFCCPHTDDKYLCMSYQILCLCLSSLILVFYFLQTSPLTVPPCPPTRPLHSAPVQCPLLECTPLPVCFSNSPFPQGTAQAPPPQQSLPHHSLLCLHLFALFISPTNR